MMEMPPYCIIINLITKTRIDSIDLRHLNDILTIRLAIWVLENETWLCLLYVLVVMLVEYYIHINMVIVVRSTLVMHALTRLMIHFILYLI